MDITDNHINYVEFKGKKLETKNTYNSLFFTQEYNT